MGQVVYYCQNFNEYRVRGGGRVSGEERRGKTGSDWAERGLGMVVDAAGAAAIDDEGYVFYGDVAGVETKGLLRGYPHFAEDTVKMHHEFFVGAAIA